ncbi:insulin-like growth factor-binding protein complex acid labile subunit [Venturia canescens]|uniref:insulin-like growth factor-binding protein complex acid labile subunit n=1 Tax=Venturia canescens TaxID=32260 RepID=UPI001C9C5219|nr:insulin-like growth factor-binding protein complex acid labile subunit [Venturia canescens]
MRGAIVESLQPYNESIVKHCQIVSTEVREEETLHNLSLDRRGISQFTAGWYGLKTNFFSGLDLSNNDISDITPELLNDMPADITRIDLSSNKILRLRTGVIVNNHVNFLNLANNAMSEIEDRALEGTNLSSVDLSENRLNNTRFVATLPTTLQSLNLGENNIDAIIPNIFSRLGQLEKIDFTMNNITVIRNDSLSGLSSAKELILGNNKIEKIEIGAFRDLRSLRYLQLANNKLTSLEKGVFIGLQAVEHIDLGFNSIEIITNDSFYGLTDSLHTLTLTSNRIRVLEHGAFSQLALRELWLNNNELRKIDSGIFPLMTLKNLHLGHNALARINGSEFANLESLVLLDLTNNGIVEIKKGFAQHLPKVEKLILDENPFKILGNGALFGLTKAINSTVHFRGSQLDIIQGGVFDDL